MKKKTIPGIYNYCDRWCERCAFTSKCSISEHEPVLASENPDDPEKSFWDDLSEKLKGAVDALHQIAVGHGIDLNEIEAEDLESTNEILEQSKDHPLYVVGMNYSITVRHWFEKTALTEYDAAFQKAVSMGIKSTADVERELITIKDSFEIITWYLSLITVKLNRAVRSSAKMDKWAEENGLQKDSDGSAKIALIGIQRSLQAWRELYNLLPDEQDNILNFLANLQHIEKLALKAFPKAMEFIRPGFDEVSAATSTEN